MIKIIEAISRNARSVISITIVYGSLAFLFMLTRRNVPTSNETILNIAVGIVLGTLTSVCAYYFGSSKDKSDQEKAVISEKTILAEKTATVATKTETVEAGSVVSEVPTIDNIKQ